MLGAHGGLEWTCFRVQTPIGKKYHVQNGDCDEVAIVSSIDKAIPVLLDYYDKHPTRWQRYDHSYCASQGLPEVEDGRLIEISTIADSL